MMTCPDCNDVFLDNPKKCPHCGFNFARFYLELSRIEEQIVSKYSYTEESEEYSQLKIRYREKLSISAQNLIVPVSIGQHALFFEDVDQLRAALNAEPSGLWQLLDILVKQQSMSLSRMQFLEAPDSNALGVLYEIEDATCDSKNPDHIRLEQLDFDEFVGHVAGWFTNINKPAMLKSSLREIARDGHSKRDERSAHMDELYYLVEEYGQEAFDDALRKLEESERSVVSEIMEAERDVEELKELCKRYGKNPGYIDCMGGEGLANQFLFAYGIASIYDGICEKQGLDLPNNLTALAKNTCSVKGLGDDAKRDFDALVNAYVKYVEPLGIPKMYLTSRDLAVAIEIIRSSKVDSYPELYDRFERKKVTNEQAEILRQINQRILELGGSFEEECEQARESHMQIMEILDRIGEIETEALNNDRAYVNDILKALGNLNGTTAAVANSRWEMHTFDAFADIARKGQ